MASGSPSPEIQELLRRLAALEADRDNERARADNAEIRADNAQIETVQAQARAAAVESTTQKTTLFEYLDGCHEHLFTALAVQTNAKFTTLGDKTKPTRKPVPTRLVRWDDFLEDQRKTLGLVHSYYPPLSRRFESRHGLEVMAARIAEHPIGNERTLEMFEKQAVEIPVQRIMKEMCTDETLRQHFTLGAGVEFENYYNPITHIDGEPSQSPSMTLFETPVRKPARPRSTKLRADQICVFKMDTTDVDGENYRKLASVVEYKAPHKLTAPHVRVGLRDMDILAEVVQRTRKPAAGDETFLFHAEELVAAAICQTFGYMVEAGLEYGYVTTGETYIFLKYNWEESDTLYYHLAEPTSEAQANPLNARHCTAVSQVLAFTLWAIRAKIHGQDERNAAEKRLAKWEVDFAEVLGNIPETVRQQTPPVSSYKGPTYSKFDRSPIVLRARRPKSCSPELKCSHSESSDDDESDGYESPGYSSRNPKRGPTSELRKESILSSSSSSAGNNSKETRKERVTGKGCRQYCTQKCLLGLVRGDLLDEACPNIAQHCRVGSAAATHPIDHETWLRLIHQQLDMTLDTNIEPLGLQGARGAVFCVTLSAYGYTFLAKGTTSFLVPHLEHEAAVYRQLEGLQGVCVPVFLGAVELGKTYYYDLDVRISYLIFLSWAGDALDERRIFSSSSTHNLSVQLMHTLRTIHNYGVLQSDIRAGNALWNAEVGSVFVIDFERARLVPPKYMALLGGLQRLSSNRKRRFGWIDDVDEPQQGKILTLVKDEMQHELAMASCVFQLEAKA